MAWNLIAEQPAPREGFFMVWSPDHPDIPMTVKADIFNGAREREKQPRHLSFDHFTHWMKCPEPPESAA